MTHLQLCTIICSMFTVLAAADSNTSLEGQVISSTTGLPLRKVDISLHPDDPGTARAATTGADGKFIFEAIEPGEYHLSATRFGYIEESRGPSIEVAPGQRIKDVVVKLIPQAILAGRVVDEDGDPITQVSIAVESFAGPGRKHPLQQDSSESDGEGAFKFTALPPGRYYLSATPFQPRDRTTAQETLVETYYPDAIDQAGSLPIDLAPGAEQRNIEIRMRRSRAFFIRGKVTGLPPGTRHRLTLMQNGRSVKQVEVQDGKFLFGAVVPGAYVIKTSPDVMQWDGGNLMHVPPSLFCDYPVSVGDKNVDALEIPVSPVGDLTGRIKLNAPMPEKRPRVALHPLTTPRFGAPPETVVDEEGKFHVAALPPDEYKIQVKDLPEGMYLKSMRYDGQDAAHARIDLNSSTRGTLEITLAPNAAEVTGVLKNDQGVPEATRVVAIWHEDFSQTSATAKGGTFAFQNLAPGDYFVAATEADTDVLFESDLRSRIQDQVTKITLHESSHEQIEVKLLKKEAIEAALTH